LANTTIEDVAKRAKVSIKTVSRVINNEAHVREKTRLKVERAIQKLGYRPNVSARSLASTRSYLIGLLYDNHSASYLIEIQNGALRTSRAQGYDLVIHPCHYEDPQLVDSISSIIRSRAVDGLILTPPLSDMQPLLQSLDKADVAFALIAPANAADDDRSIYTNDQEACAEMTRYLASLGHRRIGFVIGHPDHGAVGNRYLGYRDGLKSSGMKFDRSLVQQGYNSFESGEKCGRRLLNREDRPTAIFAANDDMAAGVMKAAHEMGLSIPGDLSVAGFDDVPLARYIWPSLTTIRQPMDEMAVQATALLMNQIRGNTDDEIEHTIPSTLVIRESTGPAPVSNPGTAGRSYP
jgi:LacI family transcriptional regulator